MVLTNKRGLPKAFELAVRNDEYNPGRSDITVTGLLQPPRIRALYDLHKDEVVEDVSDRVWSLFGSALHVILERAGAEAGDAVEERLYTIVRKWVIGGKYDSLRIKEGTLTDYKTTSVFTRIYHSRDDDWTTQLNLLAALCRLNDISPISNLSIVALYRDWAESKVDGKNYPQSNVEEIPIDCWPQDECMAKMEELVEKHQLAEEVLPLCSNEDRWLDKRTGKYRRCERYCSVAQFCTQFQSSKEVGDVDEK